MVHKIQKVALAGATGNVGRWTLKALIADGFNVTVLARKQGSFPDGVTVKVVDFGFSDALKEALKGQDAFVDCTLVHDDTPTRLIDAAAAAGVYRYIPSDFSLDFNNRNVHGLPVFFKKDMNDKHLIKKCEETGMTWSIICNGAFLDWNLRSGFMNIDIYKKKVNYINDGSNVHVWTTLEATGKAVSGTLLHPSETENRPVYVQSVNKSQKQMADLCKEALGFDDWEETKSDMEHVLAGALEEFQAGNFGWNVFGDMIRYANSRPDFSCPWSKDDNPMLGVETMTDDEVKDLVKTIVAEKRD
ncbi:isoflavone reductase family protein [Colletotrichum incanum]|uniref:Isoflavone reductase family protein n=1 Tax=Colletotrichum incanum TaxID=1573173 RepID=A0A167A4N4_COLIC|nr:isoflavone reductase family protein [Colletotrichum incanum]OHX01238.1 isoflavone reductase family protein [Colletotrichum incanum]